MREKIVLVWGLCAGVLFAAGLDAVRAEEVKGRWRFEFQVGNLTHGGKINSKSGDSQTILPASNDPNATSVVVGDPRPNEGSTRYAEARGDGRIEFHASYGLFGGANAEFILDVGVGYQRSRIRNLELSYSFDFVDYAGQLGCESLLAVGKTTNVGPMEAPEYSGALSGCRYFADATASDPGGVMLKTDTSPLPEVRRETGESALLWVTELIEGGELRTYPISIEMMARFRPTKRMNPYIGAGVGYLFADFDESGRFAEIADELEGSLVSYTQLDLANPLKNEATGLVFGRTLTEFDAVSVDTDGDGVKDTINVLQLGHRMIRPQIDTPDTPFLQARGGFEYQVRPRWSIFGEGKFFWAQKDIRITADGREEFGTPTQAVTIPALQNGQLNPATFPFGGLPAYVIEGGLQQPGVDLDGNPFEGPESGQPGEYYFQGGKIKYGGWAFTVGLRVTL